MSNKRFAKKGYYKNHFCRSLHEFHFCLYLDKVKNFDFFTEPFSMKSILKKKIPDILYVDHDNKKLCVVEIKPNFDELMEVIIDYSTYSFKLPAQFKDLADSYGYSVEFEFYQNTSMSTKSDIIDTIGKDQYLIELEKYKSQQNTYTGFPGQLNPMYGKTHTNETKAKIAKTASHPGKLNGMYGKTHTADAKKRSAAKWKDSSKKVAMMKKGMLSHISKFTDEQYTIFMVYANDILSGNTHKRPDFINRAYTVNQKNVTAWFGDADTFLKECENVK